MPGAALPAGRSRAAAAPAILPRPTPATAMRVAVAATPRLTRAAATPRLTRAAATPRLTRAAASTAGDPTGLEVVSIPAGSTPVGAITTVDASGLALTSASASASRSAGATMPVTVAATTTDTATGSRLPVMQPPTRVTNRTVVARGPLGVQGTTGGPPKAVVAAPVL